MYNSFVNRKCVNAVQLNVVYICSYKVFLSFYPWWARRAERPESSAWIRARVPQGLAEMLTTGAGALPGAPRSQHCKVGMGARVASATTTRSTSGS